MDLQQRGKRPLALGLVRQREPGRAALAAVLDTLDWLTFPLAELLGTI